MNNLNIRRKPKTSYIKVQEGAYIKKRTLLEFLRTGKYTIEDIIAKVKDNNYDPDNFEIEIEGDKLPVFIAQRNKVIYENTKNLFQQLKVKSLIAFFYDCKKLNQVNEFCEPERIMENTKEESDDITSE